MLSPPSDSGLPNKKNISTIIVDLPAICVKLYPSHMLKHKTLRVIPRESCDRLHQFWLCHSSSLGVRSTLPLRRVLRDHLVGRYYWGYMSALVVYACTHRHYAVCSLSWHSQYCDIFSLAIPVCSHSGKATDKIVLRLCLKPVMRQR